MLDPNLFPRKDTLLARTSSPGGSGQWVGSGREQDGGNAFAAHSNQSPSSAEKKNRRRAEAGGSSEERREVTPAGL